MKQSQRIKILEKEIEELKRKRKLPLLEIALFLIFAYISYVHIQVAADIPYSSEVNEMGLEAVRYVYPLIFEYIYISIAIVSLTAAVKGGYNNLSLRDDGLIFGLIFGSIFGLIGGLILGLIGDLILGLIFGLIFGLIGGLSDEFKR